jgi:hypothetical protein
MKSTIVRVIGSLCVLLLALGLTACGGDDGGGSASGPDPERYCDLVAELETAGGEAFDDIEADEDATEEDFAAAGKQFAEDQSENFDELIAVAPEEIKEDVELLIQSIRAQSGLADEVDQEEASAAEERITAWEEDNC